MSTNRVTNPKKRREIEAFIGGAALWAHTNGGRGRTIHVVGADGREWSLWRDKGNITGRLTGIAWTPNGNGSWCRQA